MGGQFLSDVLYYIKIIAMEASYGWRYSQNDEVDETGGDAAEKQLSQSPETAAGTENA